MLATNNDILFDDVALINLSGRSGESKTMLITYGDCDNRYEAEADENHFAPLASNYSDCNN